MLILFDVDATLISTSGSGMKAMLDAGRDLFGPSFSVEGIEFAGRLDPLIIHEMFVKHAVPSTPENWDIYRSTYTRYLQTRLADATTHSRALPGVMPLLTALEATPGIALGVLTGNFRESGCLKLRACGIEPHRFHLHVWGDESASNPPKRDDLPGVAIHRYRERFGKSVASERVVVIGDTPHDVRCAKAHQCRSLAVATGSFTLETLQGCEPTHAVADLSDTEAIVKWLTNLSR